MRKLRARKVLSWILVAMMIITLLPFSSLSARADDATSESWWTRLAGANRFDTMEKVLQEAYEDGSCTSLVVASGMDYADALTGASLAGALECPIVLTSDVRLLPYTKNEIERLAAPNCEVYVLGGTAAVSESVFNQIKDLKNVASVKRIAGPNREQTALKVLEEGQNTWGETVILATGMDYADTLAISPYAYAAKTPILLGRGNGKIGPDIQAVFDAGTFKKVVIVGGTGAINADVEAHLKGLEGVQVLRLAGGNRFETALNVARWELGMEKDAAFQPEVEMKADGMGIATGMDFADALGSVSLLGKTKSVLALTLNPKGARQLVINMVNELIVPNVNKMKKGYIFGGTGAVNDEIEALLNEAMASQDEVLSVDEILEVMKDYENKQISAEVYTVRGVVTDSWDYSTTYHTVSAWMQSDDGSNPKAFELYNIAFDESITEDYTGEDKLVGKIVTAVGYVQKYNDTTYEMPFLNAGVSPTGEKYQPLIIKVEDADLTDEQKVDYELGKLSLAPLSYEEAAETTLPVPEKYTEVQVSWASDSEYAKIEGDKMVVTIPSEDVTAKVTATLTLGDISKTKEFEVKIFAKKLTAAEILAMVDALDDGGKLTGEYTLKGVISSIPYYYSASNGTTFVMDVLDESGNKIENGAVKAFKFKTGDAAKITIGDTVTVTGTLMKYNGEREFDTGTVTIDEKGTMTYAEIAALAKELATSAGVGVVSLNGRVKSITTEYTESAGNVTFVMDALDEDCNDLELEITGYKVGGEAAATLAVGSIVKVTGILGSFKGTLEFMQGSEAIFVETPELSDQQKVEEQAAALELSEGPYTEATEVTLPLPELYPETTIVWSSESPLAVVDEAQEKLTITLPEDEDKTVPVKAALTLGTGSTEKVFNLQIKKAEEPVHYETVEEILTALYALGSGETLPGGPYELEGKITAVNTAYNASNAQISVTIVVDGFDDYPVECFKLTAEQNNTEMLAALASLKYGDTIKVKGELKDYKGTKEFNEGCLLLAYEAGSEAEDVTWSKVNWADITAEDTISITMTKDGKTYALAADPATANAAATEVTVAEGIMTTKGEDGFAWKREAVDGGFAFRRKAKTTQSLYSVSSSTGVRVGVVPETDADATFALDEAKGYLKSKSDRYLGVYSGQDWRAYKLSGGAVPAAIAGTLEFWKLGEGGEQPPEKSDQEKVEEQAAALVLSEGPYEEATVVTLPLPELYPETTIVWSSESPLAVVDEAQEKLTITLPEDEDKTVPVKAALTLGTGSTEKTFNLQIKKAEAAPVIYETVEQILTALYALEDGEVLSDGYLYELEGKITKVNTAFDEANFRISVTIVMEGFDDYPVMAYRLTAEDEDMKAVLPDLKVNDTIKVKGKLKNYGGTREFDQGCLLLAYTEGEAVVEEEYTWVKSSWAEIGVDEVFAITMSKDGVTYLLTGINEGSATPPAKVVTVSEDGQTMTTLGLDENAWLKEETEAGLKLRWAAEKDFYLNTKGDKNNQLRVSNRTGDDVYSIVSLDEASNYLTIYVSETVVRYVGVYFENGVAKDFRTYNNMSANIAGETLGIWKLKDGSEEPPVGPTDAEKLETEYQNLNLGSISADPGIVSEDTTYPLPVKGSTYEDVQIAWESDAESVAVVDGNLVITQIEVEVVAKVTATLSLNGQTREKEFTITVTAKEGGEQPEEVTETIVVKELPQFEHGVDLDSVTFGNILMTFEQGGGSTHPRYWTDHIRVYAKGSFTVSTVDQKPIKKIVMTFSGTSYNGSLSTTDGTYAEDGATGTWTGSAASVDFTLNIATGHMRLLSIEVTYGD